MPTLNTAQTATVNITTPGAFLTVDCSSGAIVRVSWTGPGSASGIRTVRNISEDLGPFVDNTVITMVCESGTATYTEVGSQIPTMVSTAGISRVYIAAKGAAPGRVVEDAVISNGSNQVSSATASFSQSDVGARFTVCDQNNYANRLNGTITQVLSSSIAVMSATAGFAATGCGLALGPDNADAIDTALSSLSVSSRCPILSIPLGVYLTSRTHSLADGQHIEGQGCDYGLSTTPIGAGSALILASSQGGGSAFINFGSGTNAFTSGTTRSRMVDVGIDAANNADYAVLAQCRRGRILQSQIWRGRVETLRVFGQNQEVWDSVIGAHNVGNVVGVRTADVKLQRNQMRQGGNASLSATAGHQIYVPMSGQMNVLIANNHFWSGFNALISSAYQGSNVMIHAPTGTASAAWLATIVGNTFDGTYGPQLTIRNEGSSRLSQVDVSGNQFFQTNGFPDATFPVVSIQPISGSIRGVSIAGNTGNASVNNFSALIAQEASYGGSITGSVSHLSATGNALQNCNALWSGITPGVHAGNIISANFGTTELRGDNAGRSTQSGTGAQTAFTIAHGLAAAPSSITVTPGSAAASGAFSVTADATNITVTFTAAPASGASNVVLNWAAKV